MGTIQVFYLGVSQGRWGELAPIDTLGNGKDSDQSCGGKRTVLVTDNSGPPTCFNLQCPTSPHLYVKESPLWRKHRSLSNHMDRCPGELPAFDGGSEMHITWELEGPVAPASPSFMVSHCVPRAALLVGLCAAGLNEGALSGQTSFKSL